jgi:hypothetical protein
MLHAVGSDIEVHQDVARNEFKFSCIIQIQLLMDTVGAKRVMAHHVI